MPSNSSGIHSYLRKDNRIIKHDSYSTAESDDPYLPKIIDARLGDQSAFNNVLTEEWYQAAPNIA